jgi:DNA-binding MarR family transcriptional regulator
MNKSELIQEIIEGLAKCQRPSINSIKSSMQKVGLSHAQISMLYMISYHQASSVNQIAEFSGITKSAVSQFIDTLVQKDLVSRRPSPTDRRVVHLDLTTSGTKTLNMLTKYKLAGLRTALDNLNATEP